MTPFRWRRREHHRGPRGRASNAGRPASPERRRPQERQLQLRRQGVQEEFVDQDQVQVFPFRKQRHRRRQVRSGECCESHSRLVLTSEASA